MKYLFTLLSLFIFLNTNAQYFHWQFDGSDTVTMLKIAFDTTHANNSWQIGRPQKTIFNSAYSIPNVLITDSVHTYPNIDTSIFTIVFPGYFTTSTWWAPEQLSFNYRLDIDSAEIALIEVSNDSGHTWTNIMKDSTHYFYFKTLGSPTDTGWRTAYIHLGGFPFGHNNRALNGALRFTFISDSIDTHKDGWMIDNIQFNYWTEGIPEIENNNLLQVYPNPSNGDIYLKPAVSINNDATISVSDMIGKQVYETLYKPSINYLQLPLPDGNYILEYKTASTILHKKITILR